MRVNPERPQCVVEIEHYHFGKRQAIGEGLRRETLFGQAVEAAGFRRFLRHSRGQ